MSLDAARTSAYATKCYSKSVTRRDGRVAEGARLESVYRGNSIQGSNPCLSAILFFLIFAVFYVVPLSAETIFIKNITVIDATGAAPRHDVNVRIAGDRIVAIGPAIR